MEEITKAEMLSFYENGKATEVINVGDRIVARVPTSPSNIPSSQRPQYKVVWCPI